MISTNENRSHRNGKVFLYQICARGKGVVHLPGNDPVRYPHPPFDFQRLGPPSRIFGLWHPPLNDSKFFFGQAKIDEFLMKIAEIEVLFTISGYISLFFDLFNTILAKFQALFKKM